MNSADPKAPDNPAALQKGNHRPARVSENGADKEWQVGDDLPRPTPVGRAEIEVLETYLGAQIDAILQRMRR